MSIVKTNKLNESGFPENAGTIKAAPSQPADKFTNNSEIIEDQTGSITFIKNNLTENNPFVNVNNAKWTKVIYLKPGMEIAVADENYQGVKWVKIASIKELPAEQVYDIEVEGTHNFVANGIVAHNTYISGNLGIGTTEPNQKLEVAGRIRMTTWTADGTVLVYKNANGDIGLTSSDIRLKKNLTPIENSLQIIEKIRGLKFNWLNEPDDAKKTLGVIAQEVMEVLPEAVYSYTNENGEVYYGVHHEKLSALLIEGIKEQQVQIDSLANQFNEAFFTQTGDLEIKEEVYNGALAYRLEDKSGNLIDRVLTAGQGIIANLKTGYLFSNRIVSPLIETDDLLVKNKFISPLIETEAIHLGGAEVVASSPSEVSLFGDLLVKGNLEAEEIRANHVKSSLIETDELHVAGKIFADEIVGATMAANYITNIANYYQSTDSSHLEGVPQAQPHLPGGTTSEVTVDEIITQIEKQGLELGPYVDIATLSAQLAFIQGDFKVLGHSSLASTSIAGMLTQDATFVISEGKQIDVLGDDLYLQKMGLGGVNIADGKVVISKEGNVSILGNLSVLGSLAAKEFKIIREAQAILGMDEIIATSSAGKGTIRVGFNNLTIKTPYARAESLIYITPTSPLLEGGLYLARIKDKESFTVEISKRQVEDINFNWLIIN